MMGSVVRVPGAGELAEMTITDLILREDVVLFLGKSLLIDGALELGRGSSP